MASFRTTLQLPRAIASSSGIRSAPILGRAVVEWTPSHRYSSTSAPTRPCPSCNTPISIPASPCPNCSKIVPIPTGITHHSILHLSEPITSSEANTTFDIPSELLDLPAYGFDLDVKGLRGKMLRRQMELHPDKYSGDDKAVSLARELSGRVNGAYEVLRDPLKRAEYLLSTQELVTEETESLTDPMLLAEILEAREELEMAESAEEVEQLRRTNQEKVDETIAALKEAFAGDPPDFKQAKGLAVQLKYWQGLEEAAKEWSPK